MCDSQEGDSNIWTRIDEANDPGVLLAGALSGTERSGVGYAEVLREAQVGTIGTSLIPSLDSGSNGVQDDREIE